MATYQFIAMSISSLEYDYLKSFWDRDADDDLPLESLPECWRCAYYNYECPNYCPVLNKIQDDIEK
jgi:hypothetical protein